MGKSGLPRQIEEEEEEEAERLRAEHPIEDFLKDMFGGDALAKDQEGLPNLDWLKSKFKTKSAAIRYLVNQGHPVKVISRHLGLRYQHVRNVATQQLKRGPNEDWRQPYKEDPSLIPPTPPVPAPPEEEPEDGESED